MKPPYFNVTAICTYHGEFTVQRKQVKRTGTSGRQYTTENVVCRCGGWAKISKIEEVS